LPCHRKVNGVGSGEEEACHCRGRLKRSVKRMNHARAWTISAWRWNDDDFEIMECQALHYFFVTEHFFAFRRCFVLPWTRVRACMRQHATVRERGEYGVSRCIDALYAMWARSSSHSFSYTQRLLFSLATQTAPRCRSLWS
jgi:hypothetical protein